MLSRIAKKLPVFMFSLHTMETPRKQPNKLCLRRRFGKPKHETPNGQRKVPSKDPVILSRLFHRLQSSVQTQLFRQGNVGDKLLQHELAFWTCCFVKFVCNGKYDFLLRGVSFSSQTETRDGDFHQFWFRGFCSEQFEIENKTSDPSIAGFEQVWLL